MMKMMGGSPFQNQNENLFSHWNHPQQWTRFMLDFVRSFYPNYGTGSDGMMSDSEKQFFNQFNRFSQQPFYFAKEGEASDKQRAKRAAEEEDPEVARMMNGAQSQ